MVTAGLLLYISCDTDNPLRDYFQDPILKHNTMIDRSSHPDSGFDLPNPDELVLLDAANDVAGITRKITIDYGVRMAMVDRDLDGRPSAFMLCPRSSIHKSFFRLANSIGIIDSGYRGTIKAVMDVKLDSDEYAAAVEELRLGRLAANSDGRCKHMDHLTPAR